MTDTYKLYYKIKSGGIKISYLSEQLGLSRQGLANKINGDTEFYASEINKMSELLRLTPEEREEIFFNKKVDKM